MAGSLFHSLAYDYIGMQLVNNGLFTGAIGHLDAHSLGGLISLTMEEAIAIVCFSKYGLITDPADQGYSYIGFDSIHFSVCPFYHA